MSARRIEPLGLGLRDQLNVTRRLLYVHICSKSLPNFSNLLEKITNSKDLEKFGVSLEFKVGRRDIRDVDHVTGI
jgi:hypothetical protein